MPDRNIKLFVESRITDFRKKYGNYLNYDDMMKLIRLDPSKNQKYLDWAGKILTKEPELDVEDLMRDLSLFHAKIRGKDIYSLKTFDALHDLVHPNAATKPMTKRQQMYHGAKVLVNNENWLIVAPQTHEQSRFFGGSTSWCISTSNVTHWNNHYYENGETLIFIIDKTKKQGDSLWKVAVVSDPGINTIEYSELRNTNDNVIVKPQKLHYLEHLGNENIDLINDYISSADSESRQEKYLQQKQEDAINEYIEDGNAESDLLRYYFKFYVDILPNYITKNLDEDKLKEFLIENLGKEVFDRIVINVAYSEMFYHGHENLGYIRDKRQFEQFVEENTDKDEANDFYYYARQYVLTNPVFSKFIDIITDAIGKDKYYIIDRALDIDGALEDIITRYAARHNQMAQQTFPNIPPTFEKLIPRDLNQIIDLLHRFGHDKIANQITAYSSTNIQESIYKKMAILLHL